MEGHAADPPCPRDCIDCHYWRRAQGTAENQQATFRSGVDLVTVSATVRDGKGRLVKDLTKKDFEMIDRGEKRVDQRIPIRTGALEPCDSLRRERQYGYCRRTSAAKFAAYHLLNQLEEGRDEAGLFAFDSRLREVAPFTVDTRALKGALGEVDPFGATSLHDAISAAAERVATRPMARRAVVVLTDGIDTASRLTPAQVSAKAAAIDVPVYIIAMVSADRRSGLRSRHPRLKAASPCVDWHD